MNKKAVLIVDDDAELRQFFSSTLTDLGYETFVAEDGVEGFQVFQEHRVDLVITDIYMPKMNGLELIYKLRKLDPKLKILAISGGIDDYDHDTLDWAEAAGAFEVLEKPFELEKMLSLVRSLLGE